MNYFLELNFNRTTVVKEFEDSKLAAPLPLAGEDSFLFRSHKPVTVSCKHTSYKNLICLIWFNN